MKKLKEKKTKNEQANKARQDTKQTKPRRNQIKQ